MPYNFAAGRFHTQKNFVTDFLQEKCDFIYVIYLFYLKSMSYTKYTYKKENVQKQAPLKTYTST